MPEPTEIPQPTGQHIEPTITEPVLNAGVTPINGAQDLSNIHSQLADLGVQQRAGAETQTTTDPKNVVTPITILPVTGEPKDTTNTHWWNRLLGKRQAEQRGASLVEPVPGEEIQRAA